MEILNILNTSFGLFLMVMSALVAVAAWSHRQVKAVATQVADKIAQRVERNHEEIEELWEEVEKIKTESKEESAAINARFDRIDQTLNELATNYNKTNSELETFIKVTEVESKMKLQSMERIEKALELQGKANQQWVEQLTASIREISKREPR